MLNYRGGSFLSPAIDAVEKECKIRGVSYEILSDAKTNAILEEIASPSKNQEAVILEKAPKVAVYSPKGNVPWDPSSTPSPPQPERETNHRTHRGIIEQS